MLLNRCNMLMSRYDMLISMYNKSKCHLAYGMLIGRYDMCSYTISFELTTLFYCYKFKAHRKILGSARV